VILSVLAIGAVRGPLASAVDDFEIRARRYWRLQVAELKSGMGGGGRANPAQVRAAEGERILARLPEAGEIVAITRAGNPMGSRDFARFLQERALRSVPDVTFVLGGAFGLGEGVLARASSRISLSPLTLPHEVARLVLVEQLYRAGTILKNEPYHKGP
jgi:23S rRNA (pseudouridine1915-N3)-methyltransferase